jgi:hypothetical protein
MATHFQNNERMGNIATPSMQETLDRQANSIRELQAQNQSIMASLSALSSFLAANTRLPEEQNTRALLIQHASFSNTMLPVSEAFCPAIKRETDELNEKIPKQEISVYNANTDIGSVSPHTVHDPSPRNAFDPRKTIYGQDMATDEVLPFTCASWRTDIILCASFQ